MESTDLPEHTLELDHSEGQLEEAFAHSYMLFNETTRKYVEAYKQLEEQFEYLNVKLEETNIELRKSLDSLLGVSPPIKALKELVATVAPTNSTILITGESGTGKELVARAIHAASGRWDRSFVSVNCGAFPETLLVSELFGYVKGAFAGATTN